MRALGIRWTMGDVSARGFEALRLSVWGAWRLFGRRARYVICVNSIPLDAARARTGRLPREVVWRDVTAEVPPLLRRHLGAEMAEGAGWKLAPLRLFPEAYELSLDNDVILWARPRGLERWLASKRPGFLLAEDVRTAFGAFAGLCEDAPRNLGIRGLPPRFDFAAALADVLRRRPVRLRSELDEQGLQVAAVQRSGPVHVVRRDEVTICSPFWPHEPRLGSCGAHFVGLNARRLPWDWYGRPATEVTVENWERLLPDVRARLGCAPVAAPPPREGAPAASGRSP